MTPDEQNELFARAAKLTDAIEVGPASPAIVQALVELLGFIFRMCGMSPELQDLITRLEIVLQRAQPAQPAQPLAGLISKRNNRRNM